MSEVQDKDFLEYIVKAIVSKPEGVKVERTVDEMGVLLTLSIDPEDMGYIIGKQGQTAKAVRTLLKIVSGVRRVTSRLSPRILYSFCIIASPFVLLFFSVPYWVLSKFKITKTFAQRIPFRHTMRLDCLVADLYDSCKG